MDDWETTYTLPRDGKRIQKKKLGKDYAIVWEDGYNFKNKLSHWAVYREFGHNEIASGISSFEEAKREAEKVMWRQNAEFYSLSKPMLVLILLGLMVFIGLVVL